MPLLTSQVEDVFVPREENVKSLLGSILKLNLNHEENEKVIISTINRFLGQAKNRKEGLDYLILILDYCSSETIAKNAVLWVGNCVIQYSDDILREQKLRCLAKLIENAYNEADFNKKFVSEYISKVVDTCLETVQVNPYECSAALTTLTTCLKYYPSWFTSHRQKVEKFLLIFLDKENEDLVRGAAQGFHYLQQVGGAGLEGINHKANFTKYFHKLCDTVNALFNTLLEGDTEIFQPASLYGEVFEFNDDHLAKNVPYIIARRIKNCLTFIEFLIRTKFPVAKEIKAIKLIELITRGTSLHRCISKEQKSLEACQSSLILTAVQVQLLRTSRLFIIWFGTNSLLFSYPISKILVDNLERCQNCDCFKHESQYQESIYKTIDEWLKVCKSSLHANFQEQLVKCILKDITPVKSTVTLNISEGAAKGVSAKSKRKSIENKIISSGQPQRSRKLTLLEQTNGINNCKFALGTLKCLLESSRLDVKATLLKEVYKTVYDIVAVLQLSKPAHPYTDTACQARLYEVLVAFYHQDQLSVLPPLQTTLDFLTRGVNNTNRFISGICERGVLTLQVLCQPVCPSLYGGSKPRVEESEPQENGLGNGLEIEFSPEHSPEPESPEITNPSEDELAVYEPKDTNQDTKEIDVVNHEINEAENDNNTNMEIEQQAEIHRAESVQSNESTVVLVDDNDDVRTIEIEVDAEEEIVQLDSEEPPFKKHKLDDEDDVFVEKVFNLRSKSKTNASSDSVNDESTSGNTEADATDVVKVGTNTESNDKLPQVQVDPDLVNSESNTEVAELREEVGRKLPQVQVDPDSINSESYLEVAELAEEVSTNGETDKPDANPKVQVDSNSVNAESNAEVAELEEDDFVNKVLDSFVDEVKEY